VRNLFSISHLAHARSRSTDTVHPSLRRNSSSSSSSVTDAEDTNSTCLELLCTTNPQCHLDMSRCRTVCCRYGIPTTVPCKNRESQNYPITRNQTLTLSLTLFPKLKPISLSPGFVGIPPTTCCRSTNPQQIAVVEFATELGFCPTQRTFQRKRRR